MGHRSAKAFSRSTFAPSFAPGTRWQYNVRSGRMIPRASTGSSICVIAALQFSLMVPACPYDVSFGTNVNTTVSSRISVVVLGHSTERMHSTVARRTIG